MATTYFPKENPDTTANGKMRLQCIETVNADDNSSTLVCNLQIYPITLSYKYKINGVLTVNGSTTTFSATNPNPDEAAAQNAWKTVWSKTYTIKHNADGDKTISIVFDSYGTGYTKGLTAYVYYTAQATGQVFSYTMWIPKQTVSLALTNIDVGTKAYIDNGTALEEYYIYIDNGTSFDKYDAYIDTGSAWVKL